MRKTNWIIGFPAVLAVLALGGLVGCDSSSPSPTTGGGGSATTTGAGKGSSDAEGAGAEEVTGSVEADGSSTVYVLSQAVAEEFHADYPNVKVSVKSSGTGGGFKRFVTGDLDITGASRPIKLEEMDKAAEAGVEYIELPLCFDALTVTVPKSNDWVDAMTVEDLKAIWESAAEGTLTKWNQVPGHENWPDAKIALFGPGADSGTFEYFTEAICKEKGNHRKDYGGNENDNVIIQNITGDKHALGYIPFAYYSENQDKLKALAIDAGKGPVAPSAAAVKDGTYMPLARPLFLYVNRKAAEKPDVKAFVNYYIDHAAQLSEEVKYVPFNADKYTLVKKRFADLKTGTEFGGKAAIGKTEEDIVK
jgi:phosphate transport system substrate-binding protein